MLTKEEEDQLNNYFAMFRTEGWKQLLEILKENKEVAQNIDYLKTVEDLWQAKGSIAVINSLLNLEQYYLDQQAALRAEAEGEVDIYEDY